MNKLLSYLLLLIIINCKRNDVDVINSIKQVFSKQFVYLFC